MEIGEWVTTISNFGFPIALTIYLFIHFEKKLDKLENSINRLTKVIKEFTKD